MPPSTKYGGDIRLIYTYIFQIYSPLLNIIHRKKLIQIDEREKIDAP